MSPVASHLRTTAEEAIGSGFVYFIRAGRTNAVKIGFATKPEERLRDLQCASPHPLHLLGYMPGDRFLEAEWHQRFDSERIRGEWFTLSFRLRSAIGALNVSDCGFVRYLGLSLLTRGAAHSVPPSTPPLPGCGR